MPKFTQTLLANQYTVADVSNTLKTAFDSLGWGTGKVDIQGGYRFTATEEADSDITPFVLSTLLDSVHGRFIRPIKNYSTDTASYESTAYNLAMYLPGVKDFRINYTILSIDTVATANGTIVQNPSNARVFEIRPYYISANKAISQRESGQFYTLANKMTNIFEAAPSTLTVGSSYSTPWVSSNSPDVILSHAGCIVKLVDSGTTTNLYIRIDSIEYKVSQNKFAFQSPNLDSPTMEVVPFEISGNLSTFINPILYRNSKVPVARLGTYFGWTNTSDMHTHVYNWAKVLFDQNLRQSDNTVFGDPTVPFPFEGYIVEYNRSVDMQLFVGSNSDFKGFFAIAKNPTSTNSVVFDTLDKSTAYPLSVAVKPQGRITRLSNSNSNNYAISFNSSIESANQGGELFFIRNATLLSAIEVRNPNIPYYTTATYTPIVDIYTVNKVGNDYQLTGVFATGLSVSYNITYNHTVQPVVNIPVNLPVSAGTYILVVVRGNNHLSVRAGLNFAATVDSYVSGVSRVAEGTYIGSIPVKLFSVSQSNNPAYGNIRYIRDTLSGNSVNAGNHWIEIQALDASSTNLALNKTVFGAGENQPNSVITNGTTSEVNQWSGGGNSTASVTVDLGQTYDVREIKVWRYYVDGRFYNYQLEVSTNGTDWYTISSSTFDGTYSETSSGKTFPTNRYILVGQVGTVVHTQEPTKDSKAQFTGTCNPVALLLSGTETPTRNLQLFAENWVSVSPSNSNRESGRFTTNTSIINVYNNGGSQWSSLGRTVGGVDPAMTLRWRGHFINYHIPGSTQGVLDSNDTSRNTGDFNIGYQGAATKMDGRPMMQAWLYRRAGVPLKYNNMFMWFGGKNVMTSFIPPNNHDFFITHRGDGTSLAFRLKP